MQNLPLGDGEVDRGKFCSWGMHDVPRSAGAGSTGRFYRSSWGRQVCPSAFGLAAADPPRSDDPVFVGGLLQVAETSISAAGSGPARPS